MVHPGPRHRCTPSRAAVTLTFAALLLVALAVASAQDRSAQNAAVPDVFRQDLTRQGESQPIQIAADQIQTWLTGGMRVFLLRGNVAITQGNTRVQMQQGVAFIDEAGQSRTNVYMMDVYGEANFQLQLGGQTRAAVQGVVNLATRGRVDLKVAPGKGQETPPQPTDPVFLRALAAREPPPVIQQTSARVGPVGDAPPLAPLIIAQAPAPAPSPPPPIPVTPAPAPSVPPPGPVNPAPVPGAPLPGPVNPVPAVPVIPGPPPPATPAAVPVQPPPPVTIGPIGGTKPAPLPGAAPAGNGLPRNLTVRPRSSLRFGFKSFPTSDGTAWVFTGGIILRASNPGTKKGILDIEGDRVVVWVKDKSSGGAAAAGPRLQTPEGDTSNQYEFYIAGHVQMRYESNKGETERLQADEVYYDVSRNVAIALQADLEIRDPKLPYPLHMKAPEMQQLNSKVVETRTSEVYSTILPSDPGLEIQIRKTRVVEVEEIKKNIFGFPQTDPKTGEPLITNERYFTGRDMVIYLESLPVFYWPYYTANVAEPLGPLKAVSFNYNKIFGFQLYSTWDMYSLLGFRRPDGTAWRLYLDYLTARGPAAGTEFDWTGRDLFGLPGKYDNISKIYGIHDTGTDVVGSGGTQAYITPTVTTPLTHPDWRGRFFERFDAQALPDGFSAQVQVSALSDRNFMEQYYQWEYLNDISQDTFVYLKQQKDNWFWNLLVEPRINDWVTKTEWLPKMSGFIDGETFFDRFIYNAHGSATYAILRVTDQAPYAFEPTDKNVSTGRADAWQEVSMPFQLGDFKIVPYLRGDVTYYSNDLAGQQVGRLYGAEGLLVSLPFSRLYPDVQSDLFNLNAIYHKIVFSGNYYNANTNVNYNQLPQLDRLNDDASDFTLRNMHQQDPLLIPAPNGQLLRYGPYYDPQTYAIRRLLDTSVDTLGNIEAFTADVRQRWQTKRGFPGNEHIIDWMTLDVSATLFPDAYRDDFGHTLGFVDYDWVWNIGDRTAMFSSGWFEPFQDGARVWAVGATINRPDTTNFMISYRQFDPVGSRAVIGQVTIPFSAKYMLTASTTWDFGAHNQVYSLLLTRKGTDVLVGFGLSYNSILNTFGFNFEIVPNLLLSRMRSGTPGSSGSPLLGSNSAYTGSGR